MYIIRTQYSPHKKHRAAGSGILYPWSTRWVDGWLTTPNDGVRIFFTFSIIRENETPTFKFRTVPIGYRYHSRHMNIEVYDELMKQFFHVLLNNSGESRHVLCNDLFLYAQFFQKVQQKNRSLF